MNEDQAPDRGTFAAGSPGRVAKQPFHEGHRRGRGLELPVKPADQIATVAVQGLKEHQKTCLTELTA
ncbi:hypothetical protein MKP05_04635 [Halomonas sp. EGI 63088]|uniref:Uncharacterized protein n=1 Tax=Halomonas flagellata TaxID=2920385 RepID=A0ABS9RRE3_9GAMM|nr:hypothetical protein [Halomonas flagellata]MCH4562421.1 hypothetical protein [Halomonas flagellata]